MASPDQTCFELTGRVRRVGPVTASALAGLPQQEVKVQNFRQGGAAGTASPGRQPRGGSPPSGDQALPPRQHRGVLLFDVLVDAGLEGDTGSYPYVNLYLVAFGEDGAGVLFSVAELDPRFGGRRVLVSGGTGGEPCRLVSADDRAGARSIRGLARIDVLHGGAQAPQPPPSHR